MKRSKILFSALKVPFDYMFVVGAFMLAYFTRLQTDYDYIWNFNEFLKFTLVMAPIWILFFALQKLYVPSEKGHTFEEASRIIIGSLAATLISISYIFLSRTDFFSRLIIFYALAYSILLISTYRIVANLLRSYLYKFDIGVIRLAIIGNRGIAKLVINNLKTDLSWGYKIIKTLDHNALEKIQSVITSNIDEVIMADPYASDKQITRILNYCAERGIGFKVIPNLFRAQTAKVDLQLIAGIPMIEYQRTPLFGWGGIYKRIFDIITSIILLIILSPIYFLAVIGVKLSSPNGPILFRQKRVGLGRQFSFLKFRTMNPDAHKLHKKYIKKYGNMFKLKNDPRIYPLGKFLRKFSIDELPQIFNVLKGDMSLIGPRPPMPEEVEHYNEWQRKRLGVKPGITGLWQVSGRSNVDFDEWVRLDIYYIENWTLWLDFVILLKTIWVVVRGRGAY